MPIVRLRTVGYPILHFTVTFLVYILVHHCYPLTLYCVPQLRYYYVAHVDVDLIVTGPVPRWRCDVTLRLPVTDIAYGPPVLVLHVVVTLVTLLFAIYVVVSPGYAGFIANR